MTLGDPLHFGRAAAVRRVSQPTLSSGLRKLEERLSVQIFERSTRKARPTPAGGLLLAEPRTMLEAVQRVVDRKARAIDSLAGAVRIGVNPARAPYLLSRRIPVLEKRPPTFEPAVQEGMTHRTLDRLRDQALELDPKGRVLPRKAPGQQSPQPSFWQQSPFG